jgi:hypothetical protein
MPVQTQKSNHAVGLIKQLSYSPQFGRISSQVRINATNNNQNGNVIDVLSFTKIWFEGENNEKDF